MIKLPAKPYLHNSISYFIKHIGVDDDDWLDESDTDKQYLAWVCPIYNCRIKTDPRTGLGLWIEFDDQKDATAFALRWA